jgi:site-specific DNA recombinase
MSSSSPPLAAAIYTRQSRNTRDEFSSCDAQFEICQSFLAMRQQQDWVWCGTRYDDQGESGERLDRPGLNRLLRDVRAGDIKVIVVHRLDRLSRRLSDSAGLLAEFRDRGVHLAVVADPSLGMSAADVLVLNIIGSFAEFEREMIRDRLADTRAAMKRRGLRAAGRVPYGYEIDPVTKQLVRLNREANRVRAIFEWAIEGKTLTEIAALANRRRWRTKPTHRFPKGGPWTPRQVSEMLANPVYAGLIRVKGGVAPGQHQAIIDRELFDRTRKVVAERRVSTTLRRAASASWNLRGLVFCHQCGRPMSTSVLHHRHLRYLYYRCRSHAGGRPPCKRVSVSAFQLEQLVARRLSALKPTQFRRPGQSQMIVDFNELWKELNETDKIRCLRDVIEKVVFDAANGNLQISLRPGAVGSVAGFLMNRDSEPR